MRFKGVRLILQFNLYIDLSYGTSETDIWRLEPDSVGAFLRTRMYNEPLGLVGTNTHVHTFLLHAYIMNAV